MTDPMAPNAGTWKQPIADPSGDPRDVARWWREVSAVEPDPVKADDYLRFADSLERFIAMRGAP
jgi:hypothetical protein